MNSLHRWEVTDCKSILHYCVTELEEVGFFSSLDNFLHDIAFLEKTVINESASDMMLLG